MKRDQPFEPLVESLLGYPLDSREYAEAEEMAGPAERAEALRQIDVQLSYYREALARVNAHMATLEADYPGIGGV
jgi:hypothetical protein